MICASARHAPDAPQQVSPGLRLCWTCRDDIVRYTQQALDAHAGHLERQAWGGGTSYEPRVSESKERPLVIEPCAVARRTEIEHVVGAWARLVLDERGFCPLAAVDLAEYRVHGRLAIAARIVITSATWLAAHAEAASCRDELRALLVRAPSPQSETDVGVCPECGAPATARVLRGEAEVACTTDETHRWAAHEWAGHWLASASRTFNTAETSALLGVSIDSVRQFAAAGRLTRLGTPRRARYDRAEVERLHRVLWEEAS